jgi:NitT/TauT family transport system ATP-binding protein
MQQWVANARTTADEPHVLLMDEPFATAGAQTRAGLEDLICDLWHRFHMTTLFGPATSAKPCSWVSAC